MVFLELPYIGFLTFEVRTGRSETCSVSLPGNVLCFPSSSANPWEEKTTKQKTNNNKKHPQPETSKQTNKKQSTKQNQENPVIIFSFPLYIAFCDSFRWTCGSLPNSGRSSAPTDAPQKHKRGGKKDTCICLLVEWWYTFSSFSLNGRLFLFFSSAIPSPAKQKKHKWEVSFVFPGFHSPFLVNPLL